MRFIYKCALWLTLGGAAYWTWTQREELLATVTPYVENGEP